MLIIDTSTEKGFVATSHENVLWLPDGKRESIHLVAVIKKFLNGERPDMIAVGLGPGSFIGTRVGVLVGKMLAYAWDIPLKTFCSLAAYGDAVAIDAKSRGIYLYKNEKLTLTKEPQLSPLVSPHPNSIRIPCEELREAAPDVHLIEKILEKTKPISIDSAHPIYFGSP